MFVLLQQKSGDRPRIKKGNMCVFTTISVRNEPKPTMKVLKFIVNLDKLTNNAEQVEENRDYG